MKKRQYSYSYYGYKIYYKNMEYTGIHKSRKSKQKLIEDQYCDKYYGSGKMIKSIRKKYGNDLFTKKIIYFATTYEELLQWEKNVVNNDYLDNNNVLNIVVGGINGQVVHSDEFIVWNKGKKMTDEEKKKLKGTFQKGFIPWNKGTKGLQVPWNKGIPLREETKQKLKISLKGRASWNKGTKNQYSTSRKGTKLSEEYKMKLSIAHKGKRPTDETRAKMSQSQKNRYLLKKELLAS